MKIRKYILLVNILLTGLVLWAGYSVYLTWYSDRNRPPLVSPADSPHAAKEMQLSQRSALVQYQDVITKDIFGTTIQKQAGPKIDPPKLEEIQVSRRSLQLRGTVVGPNKEGSYAIISDSKAAEGNVYRLNDLLQNARIVEIQPDRVILDAEGRREALVLTYELGIGQKESAVPSDPKAQPPQPTVKLRGGTSSQRRVAK